MAANRLTALTLCCVPPLPLPLCQQGQQVERLQLRLLRTLPTWQGRQGQGLASSPAWTLLSSLLVLLLPLLLDSPLSAAQWHAPHAWYSVGGASLTLHTALVLIRFFPASISLSLPLLAYSYLSS